MKTAAALCVFLSLGACATAQPPSAGFLSSYDGLKPQTGNLRVAVRDRADAAALARIQRVAIRPTQFGPRADVAWMTDAERAMILREVDAQLCFEVSKRFELTAEDLADAFVRAAVTEVDPTGRVGSAASAAASFFIPGPIGVRAPGTLGSFTAEAELLDRADVQIAAVTWSRKANAIGTDNPSLSRIGDAMQFAEPFGDAVGKTIAVKGAKTRKIEVATDPCRQYGARFRPEGFVGKMVTGLYVPELSGAKGEQPPN